MTTFIIVTAGIVVYALYQRRRVKFNLKVWFANVSLEAEEPGQRQAAPRPAGGKLNPSGVSADARRA